MHLSPSPDLVIFISQGRGLVLYNISSRCVVSYNEKIQKIASNVVVSTDLKFAFCIDSTLGLIMLSLSDSKAYVRKTLPLSHIFNDTSHAIHLTELGYLHIFYQDRVFNNTQFLTYNLTDLSQAAQLQKAQLSPDFSNEYLTICTFSKRKNLISGHSLLPDLSA